MTRIAPRTLLSSKESILDQAPGRKVDFGRRETAADERQERGFRTAPRATMRYRVARALATRINAPTFDRSPIISRLFSTGSGPHSDDRNPHSGADPCPHGGDPPARQAAAGYCRPADDRPCAAPGRGRKNRPRGGGHRYAGDRGRGDVPWRPSRHDALGPSVRVGPDL